MNSNIGWTMTRVEIYTCSSTSWYLEYPAVVPLLWSVTRRLSLPSQRLLDINRDLIKSREVTVAEGDGWVFPALDTVNH